METTPLKIIVESILLAAGRPLTLDQLLAMFDEKERPERADVREAIEALQADYADRGIDLVQVGGGYRIQVRESMQPWVARLWEEKPARYSRALLETLALIAYRQPITRGEIESVRGVAVSTNIMKTLLEREWVHVVGHRDVPGRPAMYGTTRQFLNYFGLKTIDGLPSLAELRDLNAIGEELQLNLAEIPGLGMESANDEAGEAAEISADADGDGDTDAPAPPQDAAADEAPATLH
ncbi:MAG: SMC-Scp complex subunit ScpB [Gammaproteobacteria bacterium]|nr:SMC-Scp complex subunit ScpB [Gammaproteobacteria bacterium]